MIDWGKKEGRKEKRKRRGKGRKGRDVKLGREGERKWQKQTFEVHLCLNGVAPKLLIPLCYDCLGPFLIHSFVWKKVKAYINKLESVCIEGHANINSLGLTLSKQRQSHLACKSAKHFIFSSRDSFITLSSSSCFWKQCNRTNDEYQMETRRSLLSP